jgi:hypothetical protein
MRLSVSENAARMRVERALDKLHVLLARRGVASAATALSVALASQAMASAPVGLAASVTGAALSSATGSVLMTAGIFSMKTKSVLLASSLVLAVGTAVFQFSQAKKAEASLAEARRERDAFQAQLRAMPPPASQPAPDVAALLQAAKPGLNIQPAAGASGSAPRTPPIVAKIAYAGARRIQSLDAQYRPLYRALGLDAAQSAKFKAIMVENARRNEELMKAAALQGAIGPEKQRAIDDQTNAELAASIRAEFGDSAVQAMERHEATFPSVGRWTNWPRPFFIRIPRLPRTRRNS